MKTLLWTTVVAGIIGIAAAQTPAANGASELTGKSASNSSTNSMSPQEFAGTWQGSGVNIALHVTLRRARRHLCR